jgi:hypothetical protein
MANDNRKNRPPEAPVPERGAASQERREIGKERVPAKPVEQRPGEEPIGNGGTDRPAAFPPHN